MSQTDLFAAHPSRSTIREAQYARGSRTSREAAAKVRPKVPNQRSRVLAHLKAAGPETIEEIAFDLRIPLQSACPRVNELVQLGLVRDSGRTRPTRSGHDAVVWEAVE